VAQDEIIVCIAKDKQAMTFRGIPEGGNGKKAKENWMTSWLLFLFHASSGFRPYHIPSAVCKYCIQYSVLNPPSSVKATHHLQLI
jgi:hypothetical protein